MDGWTHGRRQNYIPPTSSGDKNYCCDHDSYSQTGVKQPLKNRRNKDLNDKWLLNEGRKYCRMLPMEHSALLAIIGLENHFSVFLRVAVKHRFYCISTNPFYWRKLNKNTGSFRSV